MQQWLLFILPKLEQVQVIFVENEDAIDKLTKYELHLLLLKLDYDVFDVDRQDVKILVTRIILLMSNETMSNECRDEVKTNAVSLPNQFNKKYKSLANHIAYL